jgi:hypothetical protein
MRAPADADCRQLAVVDPLSELPGYADRLSSGQVLVALGGVIGFG